MEEPDTDDLVLPATDEEMNDSDAAFTDLPSFPPLTEETSSPVESSEGLPSIPENNDLPIELPSDPLPLPPSSDEEAASLPELPGFDQAEESMNNENLPLPSLPDDSDAGGLPALPGIEEDGGLPPLPGDDSGLGDLPPLPPLP